MNNLSAKHFIFFLLGVTFISYKSYMSIFIDIGGRDTWLYALISCCILVGFIMYILHIATSKNTYDMRLIFNLGLSKHVGNIFIFLFSIGLFISALEAASVEANLIKTNYFIETPVWYSLIFFLLPSFFMVGKKLSSILTVILISVSILIANTLIFAILSEGYKDMNYLLPVLGDGFNSSIFNSILMILGSISSATISLPFLKFITKNSKLKKHTFITLGLLSFLIVYSTIGVISSFGPLRAANIFYPEFVQGQLISNGGFIEFGEFFFLLQSVLGLFLKYIISTYGIYLLYENKIKNTKAFIIIYSISIFILATFISRDTYLLFDLLNCYPIVNIIFLLIIPFIGFSLFNFNLFNRTDRKK